MKTIIALLTAFALVYGINLAWERHFGPTPLTAKINSATAQVNDVAVDAGRTADQVQSDAEKKAAEARRISDAVRASADDLAKQAQAAKDVVSGK